MSPGGSFGYSRNLLTGISGGDAQIHVVIVYSFKERAMSLSPVRVEDEVACKVCGQDVVVGLGGMTVGRCGEENGSTRNCFNLREVRIPTPDL